MIDENQKKQMIEARNEYVELIKAELLGPGSEFSVPDKEHELISANPTSRYSVGILFPQENQNGQDDDETIPVSEELETICAENEGEDVSREDEMRQKHREQKYSEAFDETLDESLDEAVEMSSQYKPSSMGITFLAKGNTDIIKGRLSFATYREATFADCMLPYNPIDSDNYVLPSELLGKMVYDRQKKIIKLTEKITPKEVNDIFDRETIPENEAEILKKIAYRFADYCRAGYVRIPHKIPEFIFDFSNGDYINGEEHKELDGTSAKLTALRTRLEEELWSITIMLVNDSKEIPVKAKNCLFQPIITISAAENEFRFVESSSGKNFEWLDDEERTLELLYRNKKIYGTGLGTSVNWDIAEDGTGELWNDFFPQIEISPISFSLPENSVVTSEELSMKYLSDLDESGKTIKIKSLTALVDLYKQWVDGLTVVAKELDKKYQTSAIKNIEECVKAYGRMYKGIEILEKDENAYKAFALANRAMFMQRIHLGVQGQLAKKKADRYPDDIETKNWLSNMDYRQQSDSEARWRPFQIAFLLMDIDSIVLDKSEDRKLVDLIWFPTGGGKTEAYLGLTAFAIFYRKLVYPNESGGTAVIMRYTLRLLAAQQFTRAATLICACESIRMDCEKKKSKYSYYPLGREPITIGLWIGGTHIPNKNEKAKDHLDELINVRKSYCVKNVKEKHNKFQVLKCPWCGTKMVKDDRKGELVGQWGYKMKNGKHFYMHCPHENCDFTRKLPIQIIDDELYENPPTLLFGTVDKFAMLPWDGRIGSFFAVGENNRAPELIIQDELHLISGALGTMVGLYETAVEAICEQKGVLPKIIASTATIRRAKEQCSVLYNREVVQFPAPGLEAEDSFFAREDMVNHENAVSGRQYVGIMPAGKTKAMTEIRIMAALLQKIYTMELRDTIKDKYWTLTTYFNSLKDLGKAVTLVDDDIKDFIIRTANRMFTTRRNILNVNELTSRISTTELNETLDRLERIEYSEENLSKKQYPVNVLLATNMISVGIDIARLNVMLMVGQPKLTSEYIQASSRVGRSFPGVVFVQYDATKSRDRSHFEKFRAYHESFYRFVEPTGATPFSKPARERGLHAVLIAMLRQKVGLKDDKSARNFDAKRFEDSIKDIEEFVLNRVEEINQREKHGAEYNLEEIKTEMEAVFEHWQELVDECHSGENEIPLYFGKKFMMRSPSAEERRLLRQYHSFEQDISAIDTLTSMRNVDIPVKGKVVIWEE